MAGSSAETFARRQDGALIRRVNQLYHELTQRSFDDHHCRRHRVERPFWQSVGRLVLGPEHPGTELHWERNPGKRAGRVVVDLACGTGFVSEALAGWLGVQDRLVAIDLGQASLKTTRRKWASWGWRSWGLGPEDRSCPGLAAVAGDAQSIPLGDGCVDLLAMNAALHHLPDPGASLREIDRVLAPGGWFALGFEPNRRHFRSSVLAGLSGGLSRAGWYASPGQNRRRLRAWMHRPAQATERATGGQGKGAEEERAANEGADDVIAAAVNDQLMRDGLITEPLSPAGLLDLVDPHSRGATGAAGFDGPALLREVMWDYQVHRLVSSDYLGEAVRKWPAVRGVIDAMLRALLPLHGSLASWLIRKPVDGGRRSLGPTSMRKGAACAG